MSHEGENSSGPVSAGSSDLSPEKLADAALALLDDVLLDRDFHGLSPRVARDLQLAASAVTHERFRIAMRELVGKLGREGG